MRYNVVVVGGGPAGLGAAVEAKRNGAKDVLIIERDRELGGILNQCIHNGFGLHEFKEELTGPEYAHKFIEMVKEEKIDYMLKSLKNKLSGYEVTTYSVFGDAGQEIIKKSIEDNFDLIVMTKSTKKNFIDSIGSVTLYVVKKSKCTVVIVPE